MNMIVRLSSKVEKGEIILMVPLIEHKPFLEYPSPINLKYPDFVNLKRAGHQETGLQFNGESLRRVCNIYGICYVDGEKYFITDCFKATLQFYIQDCRSQSLGHEGHLIHSVTRLTAEIFSMLAEALQDIKIYIANRSTNQQKMFFSNWQLSLDNIFLDNSNCENLTIAAVYKENQVDLFIPETNRIIHDLSEQGIDQVFVEKSLVHKAANSFFQMLSVALGMNRSSHSVFDKSEDSESNAAFWFVINSAKVPPRMFALLSRCMGNFENRPNFQECQQEMDVILFTRALPLQSPVSNHQFLLKNNILCAEEWENAIGSVARSGYEAPTENEMDPFEQWKRHRPCSSEVLALLDADELKNEPSLLYCERYFVKYSLDSQYKAIRLCRMLDSQGGERLEVNLVQLKKCLKDEASKDYQMKSVFQNLQFASDSEFTDLCKMLQNKQLKNLLFNQAGPERFWTKAPLQQRLQEHRDQEANSFSAMFTNNAVETAFGKPFVLVFVFFVGSIICVGGFYLVYNNIRDGNFNENAYNIAKEEYDSQTGIMIEGIIVLFLSSLVCMSSLAAGLISPLRGKFVLELAVLSAAVFGLAPFIKVLIDFSKEKLCMQASPKVDHLKHCADGCHSEACEIIVHSLFFWWGLFGKLLMHKKQNMFWVWILGMPAVSLLVFFSKPEYKILGSVVLIILIGLACQALRLRIQSEDAIKETVKEYDITWNQLMSSHKEQLDELATMVEELFFEGHKPFSDASWKPGTKSSNAFNSFE